MQSTYLTIVLLNMPFAFILHEFLKYASTFLHDKDTKKGKKHIRKKVFKFICNTQIEM